MTKVLITGGRSAAALEIARGFHKMGYEVHVADCVNARITRWSKAVREFHFYASPRVNSMEFINNIRNLVKNVQPELIIPTCEEVFYLAQPELREKLKDRLFLPELSTLQKLHNKYEFAAYALGLGLNVPETHLLNSKGDCTPYEKQPGDWVFKRCFSRFGEAHFIRPNHSEFIKIKPTKKAPWIAQSAVNGVEVSFYAVARNGALTAFSPYGSNWRLKGGASISFDPVDRVLYRQLKSIAERMAAGLTGQFSCDLIVDDAGEPWLIECNPRATSGVHLMRSHPRWVQSFFSDSPLGLIETTKTQSYHILPAMLFFGIGAAIRSRRLKAWMVQLVKGVDVTGRSGDRLPFWGALLDGLIFTAKGWRYGISATAATTMDIEWNGEPFP